MTKVELLAVLEQYEDDDTFLVSSDEEGNEYREASLGDPEKAVKAGPREWEILHPDDVAAGEYDEDVLEEAIRVGVFW